MGQVRTGSTKQNELDRLAALRADVAPTDEAEFPSRLARAAKLMREYGFDAVYLTAGSSLYYFTGTTWPLTERMAGAVIFADGGLDYIAPAFEKPTFEQHATLAAEIHTWEEHASPFGLFLNVLASRGVTAGTIGIDEATPFHHFAEISALSDAYTWKDARPVTAGCRTCKSAEELRLIQAAMNMTLEVHRSARRILQPGISTTEVAEFIDAGHRAIGGGPSTFCAVQFGEATAYPHGVPYPQELRQDDIVLIDTGCRLHKYHSDITRTYMFGEASDLQRSVWEAEKKAQAVAFDTARVGVRCGDVDIAARQYLENEGYGPGYQVPGLPHRTGHGLGLDIHEWPYLVQSEDTVLAPGMCFSNEPMLCLYGEFGVRLEDHFYMTEDAAAWFTTPSTSIDEPFGPGGD